MLGGTQKLSRSLIVNINLIFGPSDRDISLEEFNDWAQDEMTILNQRQSFYPPLYLFLDALKKKLSTAKENLEKAVDEFDVGNLDSLEEKMEEFDEAAEFARLRLEKCMQVGQFVSRFGIHY